MHTPASHAEPPWILPLRPWGPWGAERVGARWGAPVPRCGTTHITLPIAHTMGPLPLPPPAGGEGKFRGGSRAPAETCEYLGQPAGEGRVGAKPGGGRLRGAGG